MVAANGRSRATSMKAPMTMTHGPFYSLAADVGY